MANIFMYKKIKGEYVWSRKVKKRKKVTKNERK